MSKVLVNFIQDRSGSMGSVWDETLNGFKQFVKDLQEGGKKDNIEYLFSLTTFDTQVETPLVAKSINDVDSGILKQHGPRGSTALYDAVGTTIKNTEDNRHGAEKIIVIVVTDGQENSSREWNKDSLQKTIEAKLNAGDWTFTYLGTQPETWDDAGAIGVGAGSSVNYVGQAAGATYATTAFAVNALASSQATGSRSMMQDFTTRSMRSAAKMKTAQDDCDDLNKQLKKDRSSWTNATPTATPTAKDKLRGMLAKDKLDKNKKRWK